LARDATARQRIITYLADNGPLEDGSGRVTALLKDKVGYSGSQFGFSQLLTAMERDGQLRREVRGKRTYKVWTDLEAASVVPLASVDQPEGPPPGGHVEMPADGVDYDELAHALLRQAARAVLLEREGSAAPAGAQRRTRRLEQRVSDLERELAKARAERDAMCRERDDLQIQLNAAVNNVDVLTERLNALPQRARTRPRDRLDSDERALLDQLTRRQRAVGA
jgi:hypothetical protein